MDRIEAVVVVFVPIYNYAERERERERMRKETTETNCQSMNVQLFLNIRATQHFFGKEKGAEDV
jgi:hypothetical protein